MYIFIDLNSHNWNNEANSNDQINQHRTMKQLNVIIWKHVFFFWKNIFMMERLKLKEKNFIPPPPSPSVMTIRLVAFDLIRWLGADLLNSNTRRISPGRFVIAGAQWRLNKGAAFVRCRTMKPVSWIAYIFLSLFLSFLSHCSDVSDELECGSLMPRCENGNFRCPDGQCIDHSWR